ncbi:sodium-coupled monocarboxylate transporter 1-like [Protopterus annectens]|uniref:sodium-coupled monocarboxylate transporter 1-like n=1 Tax=Protopterus annectens TaxID=7888 RepID=UPI001CFA8F28|nr:sodium-coupled monocarboxylate transporter 1-like [Protopterus annectens]
MSALVSTDGEVAQFSVWDYVVFVVILLVAAAVGIVQAFIGKGQNTSRDFLLGGRQMTALPVALSLTASFMSGITVIGTPSEAYRFGVGFWLFAFAYCIMSAVTAEIYLPVFYRLGITSTYEYLQMRYNTCVRLVATTIYIFQTAIYTGMVIYAPALALNQITGLDLWGVLVATGVVCTLYCTVGGLKAVIWTDVFQMVIMLTGFAIVIIRGSVLQGGFQNIWNISYYGGRLEAWDFDVDPLKRHTFWSVVVRGSFMWTAVYSANQSQVQRYIACKSQNEAKLSLYYNMFGLVLTVSLAMLTGLTMYSFYHDCDPLRAKRVGAADQLLPYLVMDILGDYPGLPGLFVAAAYSGTLSTVSSSINALTAVTLEDCIKPCLSSTSISERKLSWISKVLSIVYGAICIGMAGLSSLMGSILQAALSLLGMIGGPFLGLFSLGMFLPWSNATGALTGFLGGLIITLWVGIGGQLYPPPQHKTRPLPLSTAGCVFNITHTQAPVTNTAWTTWGTPSSQKYAIEKPAIADSWYSLSYLFLTPVGFLSTMILGLIVSLMAAVVKTETSVILTQQSFLTDVTGSILWDTPVLHIKHKSAFN